MKRSLQIRLIGFDIQLTQFYFISFAFEKYDEVHTYQWYTKQLSIVSARVAMNIREQDETQETMEI